MVENTIALACLFWYLAVFLVSAIGVYQMYTNLPNSTKTMADKRADADTTSLSLYHQSPPLASPFNVLTLLSYAP